MIVGGKGDPKKIKDRYQYLKHVIDNDPNYQHDKKDMEKRLGQLSKGVAIVKVGGTTEVE